MRIGPDFQAEMPQTTGDCELHKWTLVRALCMYARILAGVADVGGVDGCVHALCVSVWCALRSWWPETQSYVAMETNWSIAWGCRYVATTSPTALHALRPRGNTASLLSESYKSTAGGIAD